MTVNRTEVAQSKASGNLNANYFNVGFKQLKLRYLSPRKASLKEQHNKETEWERQLQLSCGVKKLENMFVIKTSTS